MDKPIISPKFWRERLRLALEDNLPHKAIWDIDIDTWNQVKAIHGDILSKLVHPFHEVRVLDAGCGLGELLDILPTNAQYTGIDLTPDFIRYAKRRYLNRRASFSVGDFRKLDFPDRSFDLVICRGIEPMIKDNLGYEAWRQMEREMLRVGDRILILNYTTPTLFRVFEASPDPKEYASITVQEEGSVGTYLTYRPGKDGTIELYDLFVNDKDRRKGVASRMIESVIAGAYGTVYGFTQIDNYIIHALYEKLGFTLTKIPGFYRGVDSIMVHKVCMNEIGRGKRT